MDSWQLIGTAPKDGTEIEISVRFPTHLRMDDAVISTYWVAPDLKRPRAYVGWSGIIHTDGERVALWEVEHLGGEPTHWRLKSMPTEDRELFERRAARLYRKPRVVAG